MWSGRKTDPQGLERSTFAQQQKAMATRLEQLYEEDFYAWTKDQAKALARLKASRPNEAVDWDHLVEEVRDLGKSERDTVRMQLARIIEHALKLQHSPAAEPRANWEDMIDDARAVIGFKITRTLRRDVTATLPRIYGLARGEAARALERHDEPAAAAALPETCPWTLAQLLDPDWWPDGRVGD
jgi:Domain of unknown function DUF29